MKPPPMLNKYSNLCRFRRQPYCSYCGARNPRLEVAEIWVQSWGPSPRIKWRCLGGCTVLQRPELRTYQTWRQTGQWRFNHHLFSSHVQLEGEITYSTSRQADLSDHYFFDVDARRCDFCGKATPCGLADACVKRVDGVNYWRHHCLDCEDRARAYEGLPPRDDEPPEFPVYVDSQGNEHAEF